MALEVATTILDLVAANPPGGDPKSQGDDHLRLIKAVLQSEFTPYTHGTAGTIKLPGGLIVKWGSATNSAAADVTVTFPAAFPTALYGVVVMPLASGSGAFANYNTPLPASFQFSVWVSSGVRATATNNFWLAIGK